MPKFIGYCHSYYDHLIKKRTNIERGKLFNSNTNIHHGAPIKRYNYSIKIITDAPGVNIPINSFYNQDGDKYLSKLKQKISNNEELTYCDVSFLKFAIFTENKLPNHVMLIETNNILKADKTLPEHIKDKIADVQEIMCQSQVDKKHRKKTMEELKMMTVRELHDEMVREEGMEKIIKSFEKHGADENLINTVKKEHNLE